jgi:hypothetical protein
MRRSSTALAAALCLLSGAALADPGYYVVTVYDDPGLRTVDFRYWTVKPNGDTEVVWPEVGLAWNVNGRWTTELLASWIGSSQSATKLSTLNWQNDFLLTRGQYPFDLALHTLLVRPQNPAAGSAIEIGPVFQTDIGRTQLNFNVFLERGYGAAYEGPTEMKLQWQVRHRWRPGLHLGLQGFGEVGTWDDWSRHAEQSHRAGPAVFGSTGDGPGSLGWQAAYLVGKTYGQRGHMFSMRVKWDF